VTGRGKGRSHKPARQNVVLVFGEDANDRDALKEFILALRPGADFYVASRRKPQIQLKDVKPEQLPGRVAAICKVVRAELVDNNVVAIVVHQDADAVESAHEEIITRLEAAFDSAGYKQSLVACPAWEMETWLMLWPEAIAKHVPSWRPLSVNGRNVGMISDSKEYLKRALRSPAVNRDYRESDAPAIAKIVRAEGLIDAPAAKSASYDTFRKKVLAL
jgi:hypothetical protein